MKYIGIILIFLICSCSRSVDKSRLTSMDYQQFQGTEAERLAKAVMRGDTISIREEVLNRHVPVDIKSEWGTTLLMMATFYNELKSVRCLLNLGADPNLHEDSLRTWGNNSVIIASYSVAPTPELLKMLIAYGGDPNSQSNGVK